MTNEQILDQIRQIAAEQVGWDGPLDPRMDLMADLRLDSVRVMTLAVSIEEHFGIEFDYTESVETRTVGDFVRLVQARMQQRTTS
jgi:acyl carrier protein